jgi:hypothetical protein
MKLYQKSLAGKKLIVHKEVNAGGTITFDSDGYTQELSGDLSQIQSIASVIYADVITGQPHIQLDMAETETPDETPEITDTLLVPEIEITPKPKKRRK